MDFETIETISLALKNGSSEKELKAKYFTASNVINTLDTAYKVIKNHYEDLINKSIEDLKLLELDFDKKVNLEIESKIEQYKQNEFLLLNEENNNFKEKIISLEKELKYKDKSIFELEQELKSLEIYMNKIDSESIFMKIKKFLF